MSGSITKADREFVETWEHISPQQWGIIRLDFRGDERHEIVAGRRNFKITTEERIITQDRIREEKDDPFLNGSFRPVVVPDSVSIESNPNALSDEEIERILQASDLAFQEYLNTVDSVATYRRMLEIAENTEISIKRFRALEGRLAEVRGEVRLGTNDPALQKFLSDRPNLSADTGPANPSPRERKTGGKSSDYR